MLNLFRKFLCLFLLGVIGLVQAQSKTAVPSENMMMGLAVADINRIPKPYRADYQPHAFQIRQAAADLQGFPFIVKKKALMNQRHVQSITPSIDGTGNPAISIRFTPQGRVLLERITREYKGKILAFVDTSTQNILSAPRVNEPVVSGRVEIGLSGVTPFEMNLLIERLRQNMAVHLVSNKLVGGKWAHDEMLVYKNRLPESVNLFLNKNYIFQGNDFTKIEWRQEKAKNIWGEAVKDKGDTSVHIILFHPAAEARKRLPKLLQLYETRDNFRLLMWKKLNKTNKFIDELVNVEVAEDAFYLYTLSEDKAQNIWQALQE